MKISSPNNHPIKSYSRFSIWCLTIGIQTVRVTSCRLIVYDFRSRHALMTKILQIVYNREKLNVAKNQPLSGIILEVTAIFRIYPPPQDRVKYPMYKNIMTKFFPLNISFEFYTKITWTDTLNTPIKQIDHLSLYSRSCHTADASSGLVNDGSFSKSSEVKDDILISIQSPPKFIQLILHQKW